MATLIFKPTEKCNSNCVYCDVVKKPSGATITDDLLRLTFRRINEYLEACPKDDFLVTWHGGEPLLLGVDFYKRALEYQDQECAATRGRINHAMQSNLTLLTEDFIPVLKQLGIDSIGTSYDPEPHVRGPGKERDSETYNRQFMRATRLLEENGMRWGYIYVATRKSLERPKDIFYFLTNLHPNGGVNINCVIIYDKVSAEWAITPQEFSDFLGAILPLWWEHRERYPIVQPFESLMKNLLGNGIHLGCCDSGQCAYSHINVGPDGSMSHCGRSADWGYISYGNIRETGFVDAFKNPMREEFLKRNDVLPKNDCKGCRFWQLCHGGCPLDAYAEHKSYMRKTPWCAIRGGFIEKYFEPITGLKFDPRPEFEIKQTDKK